MDEFTELERDHEWVKAELDKLRRRVEELESESRLYGRVLDEHGNCIYDLERSVRAVADYHV